MLRIGGAIIRVASQAYSLAESDDAHYDAFRVTAAAVAARPADILVDVAPGPPPATSGPLLFDCDGAWAAWGDEDGYRLCFPADAVTAPHLAARINADTSAATIYVGESWTRFFPETDEAGKRVTGDPFRYPLDQLVIMHHLATRGGVIVHSAGLDLDGLGIVFPGVSGAGKTTLSHLLTDAGLGDGMLSDDRTIVRTSLRDGDPAVAWGTPWPGDAGITKGGGVTLGALCFLAQGDEPAVTPLAPAEGVRRLFPVISCPWYDRNLTGAVLETCARLVDATPCFEFRFPRDARAAGLLLEHAAALS